MVDKAHARGESAGSDPTPVAPQDDVPEPPCAAPVPPQAVAAGAHPSGHQRERSCLHPDHTSPCSLCTEAPDVDDWNAFELVGEKG